MLVPRTSDLSKTYRLCVAIRSQSKCVSIVKCYMDLYRRISIFTVAEIKINNFMLFISFLISF